MAFSKVSVSDLASFLSCPRQWWFNYYWRTPVPAPPFWIGQIVHAGLEAYYKTGSPEEALGRARKFIVGEIDRLSVQFPEWSGVEASLTIDAEMALALIANYCIFDEENPLKAEIVRVEMPVRMPTIEGVGLISGRIDLLLRSKETGRLWIVDHKTVGRAPNLAGLDVDEQMTAYAWLVWRLYGEVPEKIIYNVIVKALPKEPTVLTSGKTPKLSRDKSQSTTSALYRDKIRELGLQEGDYAEMLEYLDTLGWSSYFQRVESSRTEEELGAFDCRASVKALQLESILEEPDVYAIPAPSSFSCGYCPFLAACKTMDEDGDWQSIVNSRFVLWGPEPKMGGGAM